ncbi:hypothetical protein KM043_017690 [Ampulex compressa]|nr:hypothetical protein KM043_017690 [Ampulex compressa]
MSEFCVVYTFNRVAENVGKRRGSSSKTSDVVHKMSDFSKVMTSIPYGLYLDIRRGHVRYEECMSAGLPTYLR